MSVEKLKSVGGTAAGLVLILIVLAIPIILLSGLASFSLWALKWIPGTIGFAIVGGLAILPLAAIPATRRFAASLYDLASIAFVVCLWLYALAFTYSEWGMLAVVLGVMIFGVGVVITGALAAIFSGTWVVLGNLAFLLALYVGARFMGVWLAHSAERRRLEQYYRDTPSNAIVTPAQRMNGDG